MAETAVYCGACGTLHLDPHWGLKCCGQVLYPARPAVDLFPPGDDWPEVEAGCGRSEAAPMAAHTLATFYHRATGEAGTVSLGGHVPRREGEG